MKSARHGFTRISADQSRSVPLPVQIRVIRGEEV
jgi:hypothetical protein